MHEQELALRQEQTNWVRAKQGICTLMFLLKFFNKLWRVHVIQLPPVILNPHTML